MKASRLSLFVFLSAFLSGLISLSAQVQDPVSWKWELKQQNSSDAELIFTATIGKDWHIYATEINGVGPIPTTFEFTETKAFELLGKIQEVTKPHMVYDSSFGITLGVHEKKAVFSQKIRIRSVKDFEVKGSFEYMTCNNINCLAPKDIDFTFKVKGSSEPVNPVAVKDTVDTSKAVVSADTAIVVPEAPSKESVVAEKDSMWTVFWIAFGWGLIALIMPCVFPLIPMTVSFFLRSSENKAKARFNAISFSLSIIIIFQIVALPLTLIFGGGFANDLSTHWALNIPLFLIFMVFAASFFGMFEIVLPSSWINYTDKQADKGGIAGPFFMALTTVLVSFSCTLPIVGNALTGSAQGNFTMAFIKILGFSMAVAVPFGFFAFFPRLLHSMPRSGSWMNTLKVTLGFLELGLGLKFLSVVDLTYHWHILNREVFIAIWIVIFALLGFYLLGKIKLSHDDDEKKIGVPRLILAIVTFSFVVYLLPGMLGAPLKMLSGYLPPLTTQNFDLSKMMYNSSQKEQPTMLCGKPKYAEFLKIPLGLEGYFDYDQALQCARDKKKPLFIDFTGHGCANCRKMEENVWSDPQVYERLQKNFIIVSLYVDDKTTLPESEWFVSKNDGKLKKTIGKKWTDFIISKYKVNAQPWYVIIGPDENELVKPMGLDLNVDHFIEFLDQAVNRYKKTEVK